MEKTQLGERHPQALRFAQGKPAGRGQAIAVMIVEGRVGMPMKVKLFVVLMKMCMSARDARMRGREFFADPHHGTGEIHQPQKDQHQAHREFHGQADTRRDGKSEENDGGADEDNRQSVATAPEDADQAGFGDGAFTANEGGNCDDVIGIGGVTYPEEEADGKNGEAVGQKAHRLTALKDF